MNDTQCGSDHSELDFDISSEEHKSFISHLESSSRILTLLGAGLSASSGLPTFRGPGTLWRGHSPRQLATSQCLRENPVLFWQFYDDRRHQALKARPNAGHYALAKLAMVKPGSITISQNIDGLSERAGHDSRSLLPIHGSLLDLECSNDQCDYATHDTVNSHLIHDTLLSDGTDTIAVTSPTTVSQLPHCPYCSSILRPAIVLFYEKLYQSTSDRIDEWMSIGPVELVLVIGTSALVYPAVEYVEQAVETGARVAVINIAHPEETFDEERFGNK